MMETMSNETRVNLNYDELAADYARNRRVHPGVLAALAEGLDSDASILEIGCGTGNYAIALRERTGAAVVGVDPSPGMLEKARARSNEIDWRDGAAEATGLPSGVFDLVYLVDVIHHVRDRDAFASEAWRLLKPGGRVCIATDSAEDIARRRPLSSHFPETVAYELARYPAIAAIAQELESAGFAVHLGHVEFEYELTDATAYRDRAFSSLHLIPPDALARGLARLDADLARGPIPALSLYTLVWGGKPADQRP
jgi:ubiquinone/menaquinone biosynthesis C-methylase UbiE